MTREEAVKLLQATRPMLMDGANQLISDLYYTLDMAIEALEQTEPRSSEKPNNCEHITEDGVTCAKYPACDDCLDNPLNKVKGSERLVKGSEQTDCLDRYDHKTEPTISKMEQVDKDINVRSKDEPQTEEHCNTCRHKDECEGATYEYKNTEWWCLGYAPIDEPQTQLTAKCLNCNNAKACKEHHWDGCVYEPKDEKTCETCRHWKYIAHEWQCEACKCQGYEPKDEPQTDCAWKKGE